MTQLTYPLTANPAAAAPSAERCRDAVGTLRHYRIGPVSVSLRSTVPGAGDAYHELYSSYVVDSPFADGFTVKVSSKRSWRTGRRYYHIRPNAGEELVVRNKSAILPHIEAAVNLLVARHLPGYLQIHASVLSRDGVGVVFPGRPGVGKTTLAAALLARGWSYATDEFALIDPRTCTLMPYPKALSIKSGSVEVLAELGLPIRDLPSYRRGEKGRVRCLNPLAVRPDAVAEPCSIGVVVFPQYEAGGRPAIEPISRAQAVFEMSRCCFNFLKFRSRAVQLMCEATRGARCYRLRTGDLRACCELVEDCLREAPRGGG
jgi:HprK-related kinase A